MANELNHFDNVSGHKISAKKIANTYASVYKRKSVCIKIYNRLAANNSRVEWYGLKCGGNDGGLENCLGGGGGGKQTVLETTSNVSRMPLVVQRAVCSTCRAAI